MDKTNTLLNYTKNISNNQYENIEIDVILKDIYNTYKNYEDIFTKKQDKFLQKKQLLNPNIFSLELEQRPHNKKSKYNNKINILTNEPINVPINLIKKRKQVIIDIEIKDINDLLKVIELYPLNDSIEYNVDVSILHKIKEPLEDLNNMIGMKNLKINIVYYISILLFINIFLIFIFIFINTIYNNRK
jgi:hypothetical protein